MTSEPMIAATGLTKTFRVGGGWFGWGRPFAALHDVTLDVRPGEVFGLLGPNGAGKTTFIKLALGLLRPSGGSVRLLGEPAGSAGARRRMGYLPERLRLPTHHTARSFLRFCAALSGLDDRTARVRGEALLRRVGLDDAVERPLRSYSKGMVQRLGLAQALLVEPDLLILDEPTDGVDPAGRHLIRDIMRELASRGAGVLLNSHILQEVELVADRIAILDRGEVKANGTLADLREETGDLYELDVVGSDEALAAFRAACPGLTLEPTAATSDRGANLEPSATDAAGRATLAGKTDVRTLVGKPTDPGEPDRWLDRLRGCGCGLRRLQPRRRTLEELFLRCVLNRDVPAADSDPKAAA